MMSVEFKEGHDAARFSCMLIGSAVKDYKYQKFEESHVFIIPTKHAHHLQALVRLFHGRYVIGSPYKLNPKWKEIPVL